MSAVANIYLENALNKAVKDLEDADGVINTNYKAADKTLDNRIGALESAIGFPDYSSQ